MIRRRRLQFSGFCILPPKDFFPWDYQKNGKKAVKKFHNFQNWDDFVYSTNTRRQKKIVYRMQSESPNPQPVKMRHNFYNFFPLVVRLLLFLLWQNLKIYDKHCKLIMSWVICVVRFLCVCFVHWMECHPFCWNSFESVYWKTNLMTLFIRNKQWTPSTQVFFSLLSIHLSWILSSFVLPAKKSKAEKKY